MHSQTNLHAPSCEFSIELLMPVYCMETRVKDSKGEGEEERLKVGECWWCNEMKTKSFLLAAAALFRVNPFINQC